jgi:hypothetical protein
LVTVSPDWPLAAPSEPTAAVAALVAGWAAPVTEAELPEWSLPGLGEPTVAAALCGSVPGWPVPVAKGGSPAFAGDAADGGSPALAGETRDLTGDATVFTADSAVERTDWPELSGGAARVAARAWRENTSMMTKIPAATIASCTAR